MKHSVHSPHPGDDWDIRTPEPDEPPDFLHFGKTLDCGHYVAASEESGGFDEVDHVTEAMVRDALAFRISIHDCEVIEVAAEVAAWRHRDAEDAAGSPGIGPGQPEGEGR